MVSPAARQGYRPGVTFDVAADAYASFMGRYSMPLALQFVDLSGIGPGELALDVGCGPGTVTEVLVDRLGADHVAAVDPSPSFVMAARERFPDVEVREDAAEDLPFADASFDIAMAQLVVPFMADPVRGCPRCAAWSAPADRSPRARGTPSSDRSRGSGGRPTTSTQVRLGAWTCRVRARGSWPS